MFRENCAVIENKRIASGHYVLRLASIRIAKVAKPGQFVQILCSSATSPLLPRPFSFLTSTNRDFSVLFHVIGKGTELLSRAQKGDMFWATGPLGNGFMADRTTSGSRHSVATKSPKTLNNKILSAEGRTRLLYGGRFAQDDVSFLLVGGGVGIPPLYHLARELVKRKIAKDNIHVFLGARDKTLLLCEKDFKMLGVKLHLATNNGSKGKRGFVTELLEEYLYRTSSDSRHSEVTLRLRSGQAPSPKNLKNEILRFAQDDVKLSDSARIYACGPTPMLKAVSMFSRKYEIPCEVSVEEPMACGFGACLGCAIKVNERVTYGAQATSSHPREFTLRSGGQAATKDPCYRFAMACSEGPVFQAEDIVWD